MSTHNTTLAVVSQLFPQGGYGFAVTEDGREVYCHEHAAGSRLFEELEAGDTIAVEIDPARREDQHARAIKLARLSGAHCR